MWRTVPQRKLGFALRRTASTTPPELRVDGATNAASLPDELGKITQGHTQPAALRVIGQAGLATALKTLAELRSGRHAAAFTMEHAQAPGSSSAEEGSRGGRAYSLQLKPASQWLAPKRRQLSSTLTVTDASYVQGLAKALAARVAELPEDRAVGLDVSMKGNERAKWHRLAKAAHAVARAYEWQVRPTVALPTRPFLCVATLVSSQAPTAASAGAHGSQTAGPLLRLEAVPEGPLSREAE
eukprot:TRINITY_DN65709_c0_g1_i1.p1 TRINITY_DN65709_c0_g1~~TRINITY_DN65709_c0_g1_i1.p1  ORF type:complete len:250 (+),score=54.54 TRINITY_DN65709_c0_g1_i1:29-751(+)